MEVAEANSDTWAVGFCDECWWPAGFAYLEHLIRRGKALASHPEAGRQGRPRSQGHLLLRTLLAAVRSDIVEVCEWPVRERR